MSAQRWRLVIDGVRNGAGNMARDEALLESSLSPGASPTLRLYGWHPPCLSLGYGQRMRSVDAARCRARGWQIVRRPSGGGALLHDDELTYCLLLPSGHPLQQGDIVASYARLRRGLVASLAILGVKADAALAEGAAPRASASEAICYLLPAAQEICLGGRKLMGSAQVRRRGALLQHGSLPLKATVADIADALVYENAAARQADKEKLRQGACSLVDILGDATPSWGAAAAAMAAGFAAAFGIRWQEGPLSEIEAARAREFEARRFGQVAWTERR